MQISKIGVISHPRVDPAFIEKVAGELSKSAEISFDPVAAEKTKKEAVEVKDMDIDLALVAGGDGTILWVVNELPPKTLILGVNIGKVGYLAELTPENVSSYLGRLFTGDYSVDERIKLAAGGEEALNEAVVVSREPANLLEFKAYLDGIEVAHFRADGVMATTPTGSTGYSLSAGGPLLHPKVRCYAITPMNPFLRSQPPMVVPEDSEAEIELLREDRGAKLIMDGRHVRDLEPKERVLVKKAGHNARFVRFSREFNYEHINIGRLR